MVKFNRYLLDNQVPEWSTQYLNYKKLKKLIKAIKAARERIPGAEDSHDDNISVQVMSFVGERDPHDGGEAGDRPVDKFPSLRPAVTAVVSSDPLSRPVMAILHPDLGAVDESEDPLAEPLTRLAPEGCPGHKEELAFFEFLHAELRKMEEFFAKQERWFVEHSNAIVRQFNSMVLNLDPEEDRLFDQPLPQHLLQALKDRESQMRRRQSAASDNMRSFRPSRDRSESKTRGDGPAPAAGVEAGAASHQPGEPLPIETEPRPKPWETSFRNSLRSSRSSYQQSVRSRLGTTRERKALKVNAKELYRGLDLLRNYAILNYTAVVKIMKKHDKNSSFAASAEVVSVVNKLNFLNSTTPDEVRKKVEEVFVQVFAPKNRSKGMAKLRGQYDREVSHTSSFQVGLFLGISFCLMIVFIVIQDITPNFSNQPYFEASFPVFRGIGLVLLHWWGWGIDVYLCTRARINYMFILKTTHRDHLKYTQIFQIASIMTLMYFTLGVAYFFVWTAGPSPGVPRIAQPGYIHLALTLSFLLLLLFPLKAFFYTSRVSLIKALRNIVISPFSKVRFIEFFLADQLCSLVRVLLDLEYVSCFYLTGSFLTNDAEHCSLKNRGAGWVMPFLPFWWRLLQCIRRYRDSGAAVPHLANAGKYFSALVVTFFSLMSGEYKDYVSLKVVWVIAAVWSSTYACTWDFKMDWGLFEKGSANWPLRDKLVLNEHRWVYYVAAAANLLLRGGWILTISPNAMGWTLAEPFSLMLLASLEIARRISWNFFRLENEHLNNCGQFRAVSSIPLPIENEPLSDNEEPDDEFMDLLRQKAEPGGDRQPAITPIAPTPVPQRSGGGNGNGKPLPRDDRSLDSVSGGQKAAALPPDLPSPLPPPVIAVVPGPIPLAVLPGAPPGAEVELLELADASNPQQ